MIPHSWQTCVWVLYFCICIPSARAVDPLQALVSYRPKIAPLIGAPPSGSTQGHQNVTYCCAIALNRFVEDGLKNTTDVQVSPLFASNADSQFPCGATYQGGTTGAPTVSGSTKLTQWLQPLVGFILPAVIFSLNVPRRKKWEPPPWAFPQDIEKLRTWPWAIYCATVAAFVVSLDTIMWLCAVFAFAGPLLLSGIYEAWIDKRVIDFMSDKKNIRPFPFALRARILISVLAGNLDLDTAWANAMAVVRELENRPSDYAHNPLWNNGIVLIQRRLRSMLACQYSFGITIGAPIVFYIGSFVYALLEIRQQLGDNDTSIALAFGMWWTCIPHISIVCGCLLAGNNPNILEAISPLPHVSSRVSTQRAIENVDEMREADQEKETIWPKFGSTYDAQYNPAWMWDRGRSKREWLLCLIEKHQVGELPEDYSDALDDLEKTMDMEWGDWLTLTAFTLLLFWVPCAFGLATAYLTPQVGLSCRSLTVLCYACSQTFLLILWLWRITWRDEMWRGRRRARRVYDEILWPEVNTDAPVNAVNDHGPPQDGIPLGQIPADGSPTKITQKPPTMIQHLWQRVVSISVEENWAGQRASSSSHSRLGSCVFWFLMVVALAAAIFFSIGGTMMQIIGVYRNCLCQLDVQQWTNRNSPTTTLVISTNTAEDIEKAYKVWIPIGSVAAGFLGFVAYIAWWYQRRLRFRFMLLLGNSALGVLNDKMSKEKRPRAQGANGTAAASQPNGHAVNPQTNGGTGAVSTGVNGNNRNSRTGRRAR